MQLQLNVYNQFFLTEVLINYQYTQFSLISHGILDVNLVVYLTKYAKLSHFYGIGLHMVEKDEDAYWLKNLSLFQKRRFWQFFWTLCKTKITRRTTGARGYKFELFQSIVKLQGKSLD